MLLHPTLALRLWPTIALVAIAACGDNARAVPADAVPADAPPAADARPPHGVATVSVDRLDLGLAPCGGSAPMPAAVRLHNAGAAPLTWSATVRFSPTFRVAGDNGGVLAPGAFVDVVVEVLPAPASDAAGQRRTDVLRIDTDDPLQGPLELPLGVTSAGAVLEVQPGVADFGLAPIGGAIPDLPLTIVNVGNLSARVTLRSAAHPSLSVTDSVGGGYLLAPGAALPGAVARFHPIDRNATTATATLTVDGAVCAGSAVEVPLRGQGTEGVVLASPATIDFGRTACGAEVIPRVFNVHNFGNQTFTFTASLDAGAASRFLVVPGTAEVPPGQLVPVTIYSAPMPTASAITDNLYGETLTLSTDAQGDPPRTLVLRQTAKGAILRLDTPLVDLGTVPLGGAAPPTSVTVHNDGNVAAPVTMTQVPAAFSLGTATIASSDATALPLAFDADELGAQGGEVTLSVDAPLCAPLPSLQLRADVSLAGLAVQAALAEDGRAGGGGDPSTLCVRLSTGHVACVGATGRLRGTGAAVPGPEVPTLVRTATGPLTDVVELVSGTAFFCARQAGGDVWCWGSPLGQPPRNGASAPPTLIARDATAIAADYGFACAVDGGADLACWGAGRREASLSEGWVASSVAGVSLHGRGGLVRLLDGSVASFGANNAGERGSAVAAHAPLSPVPGLVDIVQIDGGGARRNRSTGTACARDGSGAVWCWGAGRHGQRGTGDTGASSTPTRVRSGAATLLAGASELSVTRSHACAIVAGAVWCWGRGDRGQLGYTTGNTNAYARRTSPALTNARSLATDVHRTCAVLSNGRVRCWGRGLVDGAILTTPTAVEAFEP